MKPRPPGPRDEARGLPRENLDLEMLQRLVEDLSGELDSERTDRMDAVLERRTNHLTLVLEDVYQPHNAGSVLRSCDYFGVGELHVICNRNDFQVSGEIAQGAVDWVPVHRYQAKDADNTRVCLEALKRRGYRIAATTLRDGAVAVDELALDQKLALCFGTEEKGLSETAHALADAFVYIPMVGFTQSLNVSVSAAIILSSLTERLRPNFGDATLRPEERLEFKLFWLMNEIPHAEQLVKPRLRKNRTGGDLLSSLLRNRAQI